MRNFTALMIAGMFLVPGAISAHTLKGLTPVDASSNSMRIGKTQVVNPRADFASQRKAAKVGTPAKIGEYGDIIYEAPEGKVGEFYRSGLSYYVNYGGIYLNQYEGSVGEIVTCDNGDVYLKNPIAMSVTNTYLKGHKDGNSVVFELPQAVEYVEFYSGDFEMVVTLVQYSEEEGSYVAANTEDAIALGLPQVENKLVLNIDEDGNYSYEGAVEGGMYSPIVGLIYGDDLSWSGFADMVSSWEVFSDKEVEAPAGLETVEVAVTHGSTGNFANIGFDGDDVYIQGIFGEMPSAWIKGTRNGNEITFASGQYLGIAYEYNNYMYFMAAKAVPAYDEYYDEWYDLLTYSESITFDFDEETMTLTCPNDDAIVYNGSRSSIYYLAYYTSPVIKQQPEEISLTPSNPYDLTYDDTYFDYYGYSQIDFYVSAMNVDGELLRTSDLYYKIYVDGDEYEFDTVDYVGIEENMTLIPFDFTEEYDFIVYGDLREVYFYFDGAEEIGVQLCYVQDGDIVGQSEIVSVSTDTSSVKSVMDAKDIANVKFFNVNGQRVSNPENGIFIKKVTYSDGTEKSFKVVRR